MKNISKESDLGNDALEPQIAFIENRKFKWTFTFSSFILFYLWKVGQRKKTQILIHTSFIAFKTIRKVLFPIRWVWKIKSAQPPAPGWNISGTLFNVCLVNSPYSYIRHSVLNSIFIINLLLLLLTIGELITLSYISIIHSI